MKIFIILFFIICYGCNSIKSIELKCEFKIINWTLLGSVYTCYAQNQGNLITERSNRYIRTISGIHTGSNTNADVKAVYIYNSNCFYFPLGLEKLFTNLEGIQIFVSKLKEVNREDFKEYKNFKLIAGVSNEIQFLDANTFEFVPKLEALFLSSNKISHINAHLFDNFEGKLSTLALSNNICQFEDAWDKLKINQVIAKIQSGICKDETKLSTTTILSTSTTPITTTSTILRINSAQFDALTKLIEELIKSQTSINYEVQKLAEQIKDNNLDIKYQLIKEIKEVKDQNSEFKEKFEANQYYTKLANQNLIEQISVIKNQNLEIKADLSNITDQFEKCGTCTVDDLAKRVKYLENILSID